MKILTICTDYLPNLSGISNHIYYLNKYLLLKDVDAVILHIVQNSNKKHLFFEETTNDGNSCYRLHVKDDLSRFNKFKYRGHIFKLISQYFSDVDIIHTHEFLTTLFLVPKNYKWVWTNHTSHFFRFFSQRSFINMILSPLVKFKLLHADSIIAVSELYRKKTVQVLNNSVNMIPNGVDIKSYSKKMVNFDLPSDKIKILISARWSKVKGIHLVLDLMERLKKKLVFDNLLFIFAGSGIYDDEIYHTKLLNRTKRFSNKILYDRVSYKDMPSLYQSVDIVLIPSLFESASIVALEAMASRKIVIASNIGGLPELIKNKTRGFLFEKENVKDLEQKLLYVLSRMDSTEINSFKNSAYTFCSQNYDWSKITDKTIDLYKKILS